MTLFEAKPYDSAGARKRRIRIISISAIILLCLILAWNFRYYPQEHLVDTFFAALQQKDYEKAYGIWNHDPDWKQHPEKYCEGLSVPEFHAGLGTGRRVGHHQELSRGRLGGTQGRQRHQVRRHEQRCGGRGDGQRARRPESPLSGWRNRTRRWGFRRSRGCTLFRVRATPR